MKVLWVYWDHRKPKLIRQIEKHNKKNLPTWNIKYLNNKNLSEYISSFPPKFNTLIPQHKADWIRLYLISHYGGVWCDASIIINSEKKMDLLWEKTNTHDFVGFYNGKKENGIYKIVETWCFASKKSGTLVTKWLKEFEIAIEEGYKPYRERIIKNTNLDLDKERKKNIDYFTVYYCLQHIMQNSTLPTMYMINADNSMFHLNKKCKMNPELSKCIMNTLKTKKIKLPYIKLTRYERNTKIDIDSYFESFQ